MKVAPPFQSELCAPAYAPVTVVVPCFRCARTVTRAFQSILGQTLQPLEVVFVDDGSGDDTWDTLQTIAEQHPTLVKLLQLPLNQGIAGARNAGWAVAKFPYVALLDADDAWHPRKIEIQYGYMRDHPGVVLTGHGYRLLQNEILPEWPIADLVNKEIGKWELLLSNRFVAPSAMVKRDIIERFEVGQRYMEDHGLWMRIVCADGAVVRLDVPLVAVYKALYGVSGVSANFWGMELGDLSNYRRIYRARFIGIGGLIFLQTISILKFVRRLLVYGFYLQWKN